MTETYIAHLRIDPIPVALLLLQSQMEKIEPGKTPTIEETTKMWDAFSLLEKALKEEK